MRDEEPEPLSPDEIFGDGIIFSEALFDEVERFSISWEEIDWDQDIGLPKRKEKALTRAATQFQYGNMAHLILCGKLLKGELENATMDMQKLALLLASYKLEGTELWGRYVQKRGAGAEVSKEMQRYYQHVFSEDDGFCVLLGIGVVAGPLAHAVYTVVQDIGDPIFNKLVERSVGQKEREIQLMTEFMTPIVNSDTSPSHRKIDDLAEKYARIALSILQANSLDIHYLELDRDTVLNRVEDNIQEFYQEIGIEV